MPPRSNFVQRRLRRDKRSRPVGYRPDRGYFPMGHPRPSSRVTTIVRAPGPIPPRSIVKMKYADIRASDGVGIDHVFNLNSIFDPDASGIGHQPYGRDTMATLYNRYRVFAVTYKITFSSTSSTVAYRTLLGWDNSTTQRSSLTTWQETPKSRTGVATPNHSSVMTGHLTLARIVGVTTQQYKTDDRYASLFSGSPPEVIGLHVGWAGLDSSTPASGAVSALVELTYHVELFDQLTLGAS